MNAVLKQDMEGVQIGGLALTSRLFAPTNITHESDLCIENLETELSAELVVRSATQVLIRLVGDRTMSIDRDLLKRLKLSEQSGVVHLGTGQQRPSEIALFGAIHRRLIEAHASRRFILMSNTSRCETIDEALNVAGWGMYVSKSPYVKLELRNPDTLMTKTDMIVEAVHTLIELVPDIRLLPLIGKSPSALEVLQALPQVVAVRVEGSRPGSGQGLGSEAELDILSDMLDRKTVPLVAECGIGVPEHAEQAMRMGFDAVLVNAAITRAADPVAMAVRFAEAVERGRRVYASPGRRSRQTQQTASRGRP